MRVDPIHVRAALSTEQTGSAIRCAAKRRAAVAVVLAVGAPETKILLIRRAERPGDPWSGHMALPGGHEEPEDPDTCATAIRETYEEVGIRLELSSHLGALPSIQAMARGVPINTQITPHVFMVPQQLPPSPNHEVAEVFWTPLGPMVYGHFDTVKVVVRNGNKVELPAMRVDGHLVWGLTHRMLSDLFRVLAPLEGAS